MIRSGLLFLLAFAGLATASFFLTLFAINKMAEPDLKYALVSLQFDDTLSSKAESWCLACRNGKGHTQRALRVEFEIPDDIAYIEAQISGGSDDSGDKCVRAAIHDPVGNILTSEKLCSSKWQKIIATPTMIAGKHYLQITDRDTSASGKYPGNGGKYRIILKK